MNLGSTYSDQESIDALVKPVRTTDGTATTIVQRTLGVSQVWRGRVEIVGQRDDGTDRAAYCREFTIFRPASGGATVSGLATVGTDVESDAAWDVSVTASTNDLLIQVTGAAAKNVTWRAWLHILSTSA